MDRGFRQQLTPHGWVVAEGLKRKRDLQITTNDPAAKHFDGIRMVDRVLRWWQWFHCDAIS
jgi:hypothetical protein